MNQNLLKVLIVDDEQNTRKLLRLCIDWESLGMSIIGDADSGIEALDIMQETKPDIVLTDIEMPYMDGLMLSKQIKSQFIDVYIVILTAHEQFSYAQQAITIGVSDFILKPINAEVITNTLIKLRDKIIKQREKLTKLETSYEYIKSNSSQLKNQYLNALITGDSATIELINKLDIEKTIPTTLTNQIQIAVINIIFDTYYNNKQSRQSITQNCINYIEESFSDNGSLYVFNDPDDYIVILSDDTTINLPKLCEQIVNYFKMSLNMAVYCGIGAIISSINHIPFSYQEAKNALKLCYILDEPVIYNHNLDTPKATDYMPTKDNPLEYLILFVKSALSTQSTELAVNLLHESLEKGLTDINDIRHFAIDLLTQVTNALRQVGVPNSELQSNEIYYSEIINMHIYADIEKYVTNVISDLCDKMSVINNDKQNNTVLQVIHHLENNFSDTTLSLTGLANQFYINPSYLSRIFKQFTNSSFTDYLLELRIKKAIEFLHLGNYKAYQLAQMVGIPDPNYFTKCFKKVTGLSLKEYKNKNNLI